MPGSLTTGNCTPAIVAGADEKREFVVGRSVSLFVPRVEPPRDMCCLWYFVSLRTYSENQAVRSTSKAVVERQHCIRRGVGNYCMKKYVEKIYARQL